MKAVTQHSYGCADVLELADLPTPEPGPDGIVVRVRAAGVDPGVWHVMTGKPYLVRLMGYGIRTPKNPLLGMDLAGEVTAVGTNVTGFQPGDQVFGTCDGSFAEYAVVRPDRCVPKPANLSYEQAAAVPVSAVTALQAVRDMGRVQAGQRVMVIGASGGVGTYAVQLAKAYGAHVTGVCSTKKMDLVRSIGADDVIDYTRDEITEGGRHYDVVIDTAGSRPLALLRRALTPTGTLVIVGGESGGNWVGPMTRVLRAALWFPFLSQHYRGGYVRQNLADLQHLRELVENGELTPVIDRTYPIDDVAAAVRYVQEGHTCGKVVLTV